MLRSLRCVDYLKRATDPKKCDSLRPTDTENCFHTKCQSPEVLRMRSVPALYHHVLSFAPTRSTISMW